MVQRSTDDTAALQARVRDFLKRLKEVSERLSVDKQGANDRFESLHTDFSKTLGEFGVVEIDLNFESSCRLGDHLIL